MNLLPTTVLIGNLTRDITTKTLNRTNRNGESVTVTEFGIAVNEQKRDDEGVWADGDPHFFDCYAYNGVGTGFEKTHAKGDKVALQATIRYNSWKDNETGETRSRVRFQVTSWSFVKAKKADPVAV